MMVRKINKQVVFKHQEDASHSYRIPSMIKRKNGELLIIVDQRIHSQLDAPYSKINQVMKTSDAGIKFSKIKKLANLRSPKNKHVSLIDSIIVEDNQEKVHVFVDLFPENSGLMPIVKKTNPLYEYQLITDDDQIPLFDIKNKNTLFLAQSKTNSKLWSVFDKTKSQIPYLVAYLKFEDDSKTLVFDLYESKLINNEKKWIFVQSLFENKTSDNEQKLRYELPSGSYLAHFVLNEKNEVSFVGFLNKYLDKKNANKNALVFSPGKGLLLKNQSNLENNGSILIPLYETNYALPLKTYCGILKSNGEWITSEYLNKSVENWLSETQLIESLDGTIYSFSRNKNKNCLAISISKDSGLNWESLDGNKQEQSSICFENLNTQIMHGVSYLNIQQDEYIFISLPLEQNRKNGKLFVVKNFDFKNMKEIYEITNKDEPFGYSTLEILSVSKKTVLLSILYETTYNLDGELSWVGFDKPENSLNKTASEISYQLVEINLKKI